MYSGREYEALIFYLRVALGKNWLRWVRAITDGLGVTGFNRKWSMDIPPLKNIKSYPCGGFFDYLELLLGKEKRNFYEKNNIFFFSYASLKLLC